MSTKFYRIQEPSEGAYGFTHSGTILGITPGGKAILYTDQWCGSGVEGECYRFHVNGKRKQWPKMETIMECSSSFEDMPIGNSVLDISIEDIRSILNV